MKRFLKGILYASTIPLVVFMFIIIQYYRHDPYQDFGSYKNYSWKFLFQILGDISTKKLLNSKVRYNTFIFGSSRTTGLYACYVQRKLKNSRAFHYGNWNESIGGILQKVKLLDSLGYSLSNVIIYLDVDNTFEGDGKARPYDHYLITHTTKRHYQIEHFQEFISNPANLPILIGQKPPKADFPDWHSDTVTNDPTHICTDSVIACYGNRELSRPDSLKIDAMRKSGFLFVRDKRQKFMGKQISGPELSKVNELAGILHRHKSKIYVVITPLYDQMKFNPQDMEVLKSAFGPDLYDFSGINGITNDDYNYPDREHFRPVISKQIIDSIIRN